MNFRATFTQARWPVLVFVLALLPRVIDLGRRPFWLDEVFTLQRAMLPPNALVHDSFANHHMPSYFLMLSPLVGLGDPQFWLRLPSAAFGALAVMMVYLIANRAGGWLAGLIAAMILGFSPAAIAFSQEARSYTMEMCLILVALYGVLKLSMNVGRASLSWRDPNSACAAWALFIFGSTAALDVLGDSLPWLLTANLIGGVMVLQTCDRRQLTRNFIFADLLIAILCAPFYALMLFKQASSFVDSVMWIPSLTPDRLWYDLGSVYMMRVPDSVSFNFMNVSTPVVISWSIDAALMIGVFLAAWKLRRRPAPLATLLLSFAFLPVFFTIVSIWRPILLPRYILWSAAPFAVLAGIGGSYLIQLLPRHGRMASAIACMIVLVVNMVPYYSAETKPRWDIAAKLLANDVKPGDVVLLDDLGALPILKVYLPANVQTVVLADSDGDLAHAQQAERAGKRVWAVFGKAGQTAQEKAWTQFYEKTASLGTPEQIQVAGNRIFISLFEPQTLVAGDACATASAATPIAATGKPISNGCGG